MSVVVREAEVTLLNLPSRRVKPFFSKIVRWMSNKTIQNVVWSKFPYELRPTRFSSVVLYYIVKNSKISGSFVEK